MTDKERMQEAVEQLHAAEDKAGFQTAVSNLINCLKQMDVKPEYLLELEKRSYYLANEYSQKDTRERMKEAKQRVMSFVDRWMDPDDDKGILLKVMENFYLFLENFLEREPHKKGGIQKEQLDTLRIKNEYDIQHFLYAYVKPIFPAARAEVTEDTGDHAVRADIAIDDNCVIEVKCTRKSMTLKKLTEEIEADMVHYSSENIYFFIYDKEKIIENPFTFKASNEGKVKDKQIYIIIHQPKYL